MDEGHARLAEIAKVMKGAVQKGAVPTPEKLTIREFLGWYDYARRGGSIVNRIRNDLDKLELRTNPDFEVEWIDSIISIELHPDVTDTPSSGDPVDPTHRIGSLEAANKRPMSVNPDDPLSRATTMMQLHDYAQLPVMINNRDVKGIVSWQSIGIRLSLGRGCEYVRDCMEPAREIPFSTPLFDAITEIVEHGYVLVRGKDRVVTGIVTAGDISNQFMQLAGPFLLIGEIEGYLRHLIHGKFKVEEMREASPAGQQDIKGIADMTLGGYCRLLSSEENWSQLSLNVDRKELVKHLDDVREIRNDVMHFDPDGLSPEHIKKLQDVAQFLAGLAHMGAM
ncbi:MAG: CBS domain-containing protein [Dehalococcoidia bacterium]|nr:CBS domain-containing protein [Dehalococcoidia bacterium]